MLELRGLTRRFGDRAAVDGVDLVVPHGQMVGVIGRSGAGKSTLLRLINRLVEPSGGTITCNGLSITGLRGRALRRWRCECAMIFQQFNLTNRLDVLTNVLIGRVAENPTLATLFKQFSAADRARAAAALDRLDLLDQALQRADSLSGGQQQRVAIARVLVQQPRIILADEPIASLDPLNAQTVMDALQAINRADGVTVICNLHTLDVARAYCQRIIGLSHGRVVFDGPPADLCDASLQRIYGTIAPAVIDQTMIAGNYRAARVRLPAA